MAVIGCVSEQGVALSSSMGRLTCKQVALVAWSQSPGTPCKHGDSIADAFGQCKLRGCNQFKSKYV